MAQNLVDKENMIEILRNYPNMVRDAISFGDDVSMQREFIEDIVIAGMGGSGFAGDLLKVYLSDMPLRIHVVKDYNLPEFVGKKSLVVAVSYSGNTEETISAYRSALRRGCRLISISSGGKIKQLSDMNKTPYISVPGKIQPRLSTPYLFISLLNILSFSGIIDEQGNKIPDEKVE